MWSSCVPCLPELLLGALGCRGSIPGGCYEDPHRRAELRVFSPMLSCAERAVPGSKASHPEDFIDDDQRLARSCAEPGEVQRAGSRRVRWARGFVTASSRTCMEQLCPNHCRELVAELGSTRTSWFHLKAGASSSIQSFPGQPCAGVSSLAVAARSWGSRRETSPLAGAARQGWEAARNLLHPSPAPVTPGLGKQSRSCSLRSDAEGGRKQRSAELAWAAPPRVPGG